MTGSRTMDGRLRHAHARVVIRLMAVAERSVASSSSTVVGNWKTINSVKWSHEHVKMPSASARVTQPSVDQPRWLGVSSHHRHSMKLLQPEAAASVPLSGRPMHVDAPAPSPPLASVEPLRW